MHYSLCASRLLLCDYFGLFLFFVVRFLFCELLMTSSDSTSRIQCLSNFSPEC